jgi:Domain of unknown function (DUF1877)
MSQSATLYRISQDSFNELRNLDIKEDPNIGAMAKDYSLFQGSFIGLAYILSKGRNTATTELVNEIFNPTQSLRGEYFEGLTEEEKLEFFEKGGDFIQFLDIDIVSKINSLLRNISEEDIRSRYDARQLNDNGIYPEVWHNDNSPNQAYNERHIVEDFKELKSIIDKADNDKDYILVFVG